MVLVILSRLFERFMGHQPDTSPDHPTNHCYAYVNVVNSIAKHDAPLHRYIYAYSIVYGRIKGTTWGHIWRMQP